MLKTESGSAWEMGLLSSDLLSDPDAPFHSLGRRKGKGALWRTL